MHLRLLWNICLFVAITGIHGTNGLLLREACKMGGCLLQKRFASNAIGHKNHQRHLHSQLRHSRRAKTSTWASLQSHPSQENSTMNNRRHLVLPPCREIFSVAPMMGHTNRHYRHFFRSLSLNAFLYTEMIPSAHIVNIFQLAMKEHSGGLLSSHDFDQHWTDWELIPEVLAPLSSSPSSSPVVLPRGQAMLDAALRLSSNKEHPVVLQLGGRDPNTLAFAAAIGAWYGYDEINLNCGCPSNAVSGGERSGGAALMRTPELVARCVEAMNQAIVEMARILDQPRPCRITVKHRLGVADAATYSANRMANPDKNEFDPREEQKAFDECRKFVHLITLGGDITKIHVHARLGLLGEFEPNNDESSTPAPAGSATSLWVPGSSNPSGSKQKVNHKRVQYRAKQQARQATIHNRSIPPLRPSVVDRIAAEFPSLEVVSNGGIRTMADIRERLSSSSAPSTVIGAMVGRAAINHPCSFSNVDSLWTTNDGNVAGSPLSREQVLHDFIDYCKHEEERVAIANTNLGDDPRYSTTVLRRRLVGVPYHLFAGEPGNDAYQRRIRKLISRAERHTSQGILSAALAEVPADSASRPVTECSTPIDEIPMFEASFQRSGPLQRMIF